MRVSSTTGQVSPVDAPSRWHGHARRANRIIIAGLLLLVVAVFGRAVFFDFCGFDDFLHVVNNPNFHPIDFEHLRNIWTSAYREVYMPVTYTLWAGLAKLGELPTADEQGVRFNPYLFHAANVVLHALSALLVWRILSRLIKNPWAAGAGAAVFAVHPLQVESVAWISSMKDVLSGTLSLAAVLLYQRFADAGARRWIFHAMAAACFSLAVLSKATAIVTPAIVLIVLWLEHGKVQRQWFKPLLPWFIIVLPIMWITSRHQGDAPMLIWSPLWARPIEAMDALAFYLMKIVWPTNLAIDYGRTPRWLIDHGLPAVTWVAPTALLSIAWLQRRQYPALLAGVVLFIAGLGPVLGLVPFIFQTYSTVADRYVYLPLLGLAIVVAACVERFSRYGSVVATIFVVALAVLCAKQVGVWRDSVSLFTHAIAVNPSTVIGWQGLGTVAEENRDLPAAVRAYRQAVQNRRDDLQSLSSLSHALVRLKGAGDPETTSAYAAFLREGARRVLMKFPHSVVARRKLALAFQLEGHADDAATEFRRAIADDPNDPQSYIDFGQMLEATGQPLMAIEQYQAALRLRPEDQAIPARIDRLQKQ